MILGGLLDLWHPDNKKATRKPCKTVFWHLVKDLAFIWHPQKSVIDTGKTDLAALQGAHAIEASTRHEEHALAAQRWLDLSGKSAYIRQPESAFHWTVMHVPSMTSTIVNLASDAYHACSGSHVRVGMALAGYPLRQLAALSALLLSCP